MRVGLFTDGLAHLSRREALEWCAERGIQDLEMGVGTWSPRPHLDLARLLAEPAERDRLQGELREHGQRLACVNAAGNPLHPAPAARAEAQAALRGAIELAALLGVDTRRDDERLPGRPRSGDSTGVFAVSWLCCDDEPLWEWQFREHVAPFWRELSAWAGRGGAGRAHLPRAASRADDLRRRQLRAPARRGRRERRHQPRPEPLLVAGRRPARDRRAARRRDRLRARQGHAAAPRAHPRARAARRPLSDRSRHGLVALRRRRRRAARSRSGGRCSRPCARAGYDGVVSIEHEDPDARRRRPRSRPPPRRCARRWHGGDAQRRGAARRRLQVDRLERRARRDAGRRGHAQARRGSDHASSATGPTRSRARSSSARRARSASSSPTPSTRSRRRSRRPSCAERAVTATPC